MIFYTGIFTCTAFLSCYSQTYVDLNGKKQFVLVKGVGDPPVIFVNGLGTDLSNFRKIQGRVSGITTTISYDRAGTGKSEEIVTERSIDVLVKELNELMGKLPVKPPYVLVGHSMGGYILRLFAREYPEKIAGLVFIDPSHEDFYERRRQIRSHEERDKLDKSAHDFPESAPNAVKSEFKNFMTKDIIQIKGIKIPSDIPVTILTASRFTAKDKTEGRIKADLDIWIELHKKWKSEAPQMRHIVTDRSGHFIHWDQPELVINEIRIMLDSLKSNKR